MSSERINFSLSSKALIATALGTGIVAGAGTVYLLSRNQNQAHLQNIIAQIHATVQSVQQDISNLEHEIGLLRAPTDFLKKDNRSYSKKNGKSVSFDSRSISSSRHPTDYSSSEYTYKTALDDSASWRTAPAYDTDYFSPDEEDEFFDVYTSEDESLYKGNTKDSYSHQVSELSWLLRKFDSIVDGDPAQQAAAYNLLLEKENLYSENAEFLWRKAKALRNMAIMQENQQNMQGFKDFVLQGFECARQSLEINDGSADGNKWFAILCGMKGQFSSTKDRIAGGHLFKEHIDIALKINPNDASLHHLLGRFCYEISNLSWVEKRLASALFGEVPQGSYEESLKHFLSAEDLRTKEWKENKYFIAKCYLNLNNIEEAEYWLKSACLTVSLTSEDEMIQNEIEKLMRKHSICL